VDEQSVPAEAKDPRVEAALREYLERLDRGDAPDRQTFLAQHPEIAGQLQSFLAAEEQLRNLAPGDLSAPPNAPRERVVNSTASFAMHGQETVAPQAAAEHARRAEPGETGLSGQFGRYRIVRALGQGAMGTVYLAQDTQLLREVAIKTPHFEADPAGEQLERFYREARAAATLRHPNICPVYDVGQLDGKHYISMAYIEGRSLASFVQPGKLPSERQILIVVRKLAQALQEAHDHGIVHRDLKPANIMVDKRGEPIIMDFGLARHIHRETDVRLTQSGMIIGTPAFMSPEQVEGLPDKIGPSTDQFSLGVILYELLTGQLPFRGTMMAVMGQILTKEAPVPSRLRPKLDPRIDAACLRMMAKNPADRFPSLSAVVDELASILKNPAAKPSPKGEDAPPTPAPGPRPSDKTTEAALASLAKRTLSAKDLASLEELARKCLARHDYDQVIQIVDQIPETRRNAGLQALLNKSQEKADEIAFLICEIDDAVRLGDRRSALKYADELLKIKPGHHRALQVQEDFTGRGKGAAVRIGALRQFTQPWNEGGWIPWNALAFGAAVVGVVAGVIIIWLNKSTAIVIDAKDPGIKVEVIGQKSIITVPGKQSIKVEPGDVELNINYEGLETLTKSFTLKKGETKILEVGILNSQLVARFENEVMGSIRGANKDDLAQKGKDTVTKQAGPIGPSPPLLAAPFAEPAAKSARQKWADYLQQPGETSNTIGMKLVLVPPGECLMGTAEEQYGAAPEKPQHTVQIAHPFYLDAYEVTRGEFARFVSDTRYQTEAERDGGTAGAFDSKGDLHEIHNATWKNPGFEQTDSHPVVIVSWNDATAFCRWLSEKEGQTYRLPTEAEWEYACRAGTTTSYSSGDDLADLFAVGNGLGEEFREHFHLKPKDVNDKRPRDGYVFTAPIGSFRPNAFGLFDMHGNAWEWCQDWFNATYYAGSPASDPTGPLQGSKRVTRGGGFDCGLSARTATRDSNEPTRRAANLGFRVVRAIRNTAGETTPTPVEPTASRTASVSSADGFVPLFNGHDLTGWNTHSSQPGNWRVENGILIGSGQGSEKSHLYTQRGDFRDFHLRVEARINDGGNSGLYFRSTFGPARPADHPRFPYGYEAQIDSTVDLARTGSLYAAGQVVVKFADTLVPPGQWFTEEVIALGNRIVVKVNGQTTAVYRDEKEISASGYIALQQNNPKTVAEFRKIEIRELEPATTTAEAPQHDDAGPLTAPFDESAAKNAQQEWADRLKTKVELTNSIGMRLRLIPPGQFQMGDGHADQDKRPFHGVQIARPFYFGMYEVTKSEFTQFIAATAYKTDAEREKGGWRLNNGSRSIVWEPNQQFTWRHPGFPQEPNHPVIDVSWQDARAFCDWLSRKERKTYRLPTEAEWEYAARAGTTDRPYASGDFADLKDFGNVADTTARSKFSEWKTVRFSDGWAFTSPVGHFQPNHFGLYDTIGNALEWCSDWYDRDYYQASPPVDPRGPATGKSRVLRGGSFAITHSATNRSKWKDSHHSPESGFRVVCEIHNVPTTVEPPPTAASPVAGDIRQVWLGVSRFETIAPGKWRETFLKEPGHAIYFFDEVARTPEYVEIIDKTRIRTKGGVSVRLEEHRSLMRWGGTDKEFKLLQAGQWVTTGQDQNTATTPSDGGFVPLFNGIDTNGWKTHKNQPGNWHVENGALIGSGRAISHLYSERGDFKDFELRLEARINAGGNSGLIFRTPFGPAWPANDPKFPLGYEAQIDSTSHSAKTGSLFVISGGAGSGTAVVSIVESPVPAGEWFTMEVTAKASRIMIKVNGTETASYNDSHFKSGHIALQQHDAKTVVEFRKIEIKEGPAKTRTRSSVSRSASPRFFSGKDLSGWKGLPGFWHVQDRSLVGTVPEGGRSAQTFLCSKREYKDFVLRFRARLAGGIGNSGVNFRSKMRDPNIFSLVGPQCEICANDRTRKYPSGSLVTEPSGEPSIKPVAADVERIFKQGDFNDFEIRCVGQHVQIKLNGQTTVDADFPSMPDEGLIGWQMHGKNPPREVTFKDIEFTALGATPAPSDGPN